MLNRKGICPVQGVSTKRFGLNDRPFIRWEEAMISAELMAKIKALNKSMQ
jgi:septal ring factor EnvC (AmiA/AmiB activator)